MEMIRISHPKLTTDENNEMHVYDSVYKDITPEEVRQAIDDYKRADALFLKYKEKEGRDISPRERKIVCTISIDKDGLGIYLL